MHEKRVRKGLNLSILAGLLILIMGMIAFAAEDRPIPDMERQGSITVTMQTEDYEPEPVAGGVMTIYKVADVQEDDGNYFFELTEAFSGSNVTLGTTDEDLSNPDLAQALADYAYEHEVIADGTCDIDENGEAHFDKLEVGLYLLVQTTPPEGYYAVNPFLVSIPWYTNVEGVGDENVYDIDATPKTQPLGRLSQLKDVDTNTEDEKQYDDDGVLVEVGQELTYKISFTNSHALPATIVITDALDENVEYIDGSASDPVFSSGKEYACTVGYSNHTLTWTIENVDARDSGEVTFKVVVLEPAQEPVDDEITGKVENEARIYVGNDTAVDTNKVRNPVPKKDVDVDTSDDKDYGDDGVLVGVGQILTYKINYENGHDEAAIVKITDHLDENVSYIEGSASNDGVYDSSIHTITWIFTAGAGESGYVTFEVEVLESAVEPGEVDNKATVQVGNDAEVETNEVHNPVPHKDVDVNPDDDHEYGDDGKGVKVGDTLTYKIDYRNDLDEAATVTITDTLDERIDFVSADHGGVYDENDRTITWTIENVASGAEGSVTFTATVNDNALETNEIDNTAQVQVGDDNSSVNTNTVHNKRRLYYPIDEEIVPDYTDRTTWVKDESVNEYNAIEIEMSTYLPVIEPDDLDSGSFTMNFHEVLDSHLMLDEVDADFMVFIDGSQIDHKYYTITLASSQSSAASPLSILPLRIFGNPIEDGCTFHVDVDLTQLYKDRVIDASHLQGNTEIIIFFFADLEGTDLNGTYKSTVWYDVYDDDEWQYTSNVDEVWVYTYEIDIDKTSSTTGNALAGATFGIYYDEDCTEPVSRNGEDYRVTSDANGEAVFYGLAEGTYYIKELEAPSGYVLSTQVHSVEVGSSSGSRVEISISNTPSGSTGHHSTGGGGGGGSGSGGGGGGSGSGGPSGGSSGDGDSGGTVWDLLPLPATGQGWAMLIAVCAMIIAGVGLIVAHVIKRRN